MKCPEARNGDSDKTQQAEGHMRPSLIPTHANYGTELAVMGSVRSPHMGLSCVA